MESTTGNVIATILILVFLGAMPQGCIALLYEDTGEEEGLALVIMILSGLGVLGIMFAGKRK